MIKYNYSLNIETNEVERSVLETYPDLDILERGIKANRRADVIEKGLKKAYEGLAEQPIVNIENIWWNIQSSIQDKQKLLDNIVGLQKTTKLNEFGEEVELNEEELKNNNEEINKLLVKAGFESIDEYMSSLKEEISKLEKERAIIEDGDGTEENLPHEWLKTFRGVNSDATRPEVTIEIPKDDIKRLIAHERNLKVRNLEDSVADIAKTNSLIMSFVATLYGIITDEDKDKIPEANRALIDYAVSKWKDTQTRGDRELQRTGTELIDKLYDREVAIADLVDNYYGNK